MISEEFGFQTNRARIGWWLFILVLALAAAFIVHSFIGMVVLGVFGYYATRPICRRLARHIGSDGLAAAVTVLLVVVPIVLLVAYIGFQFVQQVRQAFDTGGSAAISRTFDFGALPAEQRETVTTLLQNPSQFISQPQQMAGTLLDMGAQVFGAIAGGLLLIGLALTLSYFLLQNDTQLADGVQEIVGGRDTVVYAYAKAVDEDLESVFFGNLLFVIAMAVLAMVAYWATNVLAPEGLHVPMIFVLGFLTGITSLIPIVVGKVIYVPVVVYLAVQAVEAGGTAFAFVGGALVVYFLVLDILPQTFLQPYITGRQLDAVLLMFGYLLGPILFGWYGFFLLPIIFIVMLEAIRIVLPELVRGDPLTPDVSVGDGIGATLVARETVDSPDEDDAETDDE